MELPNAVPEPGFYYHYKHNPHGPINNYAYEFLSVGFHTEEDRGGDAHFVNYRPLYKSAAVYQASLKLGVACVDNRPLGMWMGTVTLNGKQVRRFQRITDPETIARLKSIKREMYS